MVYFFCVQQIIKKNKLKYILYISKNAKCTTRYTAHCLRATAIQGMSDAGLELRHIMLMSGHKNESSVRSYSRDCSTSQKKSISTTLSTLVSGNSTATHDHGNRQMAILPSPTDHTHEIAANTDPQFSQLCTSQFLSSHQHGFISNSTLNNCSFSFK